MAAPREQSDRNTLVDDVVFGQQDAKGMHRGGDRLDRRLARRLRRLPKKRATDRVEQVGLPDRLHQVLANPELAVTGRVAELIG